MARPDRPSLPPTVLTVDSTRWVSPHLVQVVLSGEDILRFPEELHADAYAKLIFVADDVDAAELADIRALRETLPQEQWPVVRTYTLRWVDRENQRLAIEFVVHGDEGVAGPWAAAAKAGDRLILNGPGGAYDPDPAADAHIFVGDASALPAIAASLEALPADAVGVAHLEVLSEGDILALAAPEGVRIAWHVHAEPDADSAGLLAAKLRDDTWPAGDVQVFAHGERESMKAIRAVLKERGVDRSRISISGYWARGRTEDTFQAEKRTPIGVIED